MEVLKNYNKELMTIAELLDEMIADTKMAEEFANASLKNAPAGSLSFRKMKGRTCYLQRMSNDDTNGRYLSRKNTELIKALEEKAYCLELAKTAAAQKAGLLKIRKMLEELPDYKTVFLKIPQQKRNLIEPFEAPVKTMSETEVRQWLTYRRQKKASDPKTLLKTQNGETVRSKSELIIADKLKAAGIPYHYEKPLPLNDDNYGGTIIFHPDFTVLNKRTGRTYYWEHFGMTDDEEYRAETLKKLETYAENGYFPGKNLIVTSETARHTFNTTYVDMIIEEYLK